MPISVTEVIDYTPRLFYVNITACETVTAAAVDTAVKATVAVIVTAVIVTAVWVRSGNL